ncbi:MAG: Spy/CpxP family protein refolding chaperone [Phycisphaerae bacterium]
MRLRIALTLLTASLALPAVAQDAKPQEGQNTEARAQRANRGDRDQARFSRLARDLDLDAGQKAQFDKVLTEVREEREKAEADPEIQTLRETLRVARESGDDEKAETVREELRRRHVGTDDEWSDVLNKLEPILRPEQTAKLGELRESTGRRPLGPRERLNELRANLKLNEEQQKFFDSQRAHLEDNLPPRSGPGSMLELMRRMREARQSGDESAVAGVRAELEQHRKGTQELMEKFANDVGTVLTPEQRAILDQARSTFGQAAPGVEAAARDHRADPRALLRAARRLELNDEQRDKLKQIEESAGAANRETRRDKEAQKRLAADVDQQIRAMLTPEQVTKFDEILSKSGSEAGGDRKSRRAKDAGAKP